MITISLELVEYIILGFVSFVGVALLAIWIQIYKLRKEIKNMPLDTTRLQNAADANTVAVANAVNAGIGGGGATPAEQTAVDTIAAQVEANNVKLTEATPPTPTP